MEKTCSNCGDPLNAGGARGFCRKCYLRWKKYGDASDSVLTRHPRKGSSCSNCGDPVSPSSARGYCDRCYKRWLIHGDPAIVLPRSKPPVIRKYTLNEQYFDAITTPEQAYWLGFVVADGSITDNAKDRLVRLELAAIDAGHVQAFALALGSDALPKDSRGKVYVALNSKRLVQSLARLGVGPRKSATAEPWDGPPDLMPHYWRGLFDGDGCMCWSRDRTRLDVTIVGSESCVEGFAAWGRTICGSRARTSPTSPGSFCWKWAVGGKHMAIALVRALYEDAPVALRRKKQLAEAILSG